MYTGSHTNYYKPTNCDEVNKGDGRKKLTLNTREQNHFRHIYLHQGAQLITSSLRCYGNIIIEKYAMVRSHKDKSNRNLNIICKGNVFNGGLISTRYHHDASFADSGDITIEIGGIIDSYYRHSSGFMLRGGKYGSLKNGCLYAQRISGKNGKFMMNGNAVVLRVGYHYFPMNSYQRSDVKKRAYHISY